ncbi:MAG TPA: pilus assembly protein PilP [Archangium sp.]|jgi:type IV pilus assembly protein PilP|uniref:pilus assembly protein PilP n=1 Tax=Archangium sp. TaxID=1872627 RepID=UPI002EDB29B6
MKTFHSMFISGALALVLAGCGEEAEPPPAAIPARPQAAAKETTASTGQAAAATATYVYSYNPVGKRDPFRSPVDEIKTDTTQPAGQASCSEPLCQWDIDQLKLVAVVTGDANPMAMVEDPMGRGHIVRRNTRMGRQGGKVTQILRDEVVVTEVITTAERAIANQVKLELRQDTTRDPAYDLITGKNWEP